MALPLVAAGAKLLGSTAAWYGASELMDRFLSSDTGKEELRRQTKEITEATQDPSIPEEEREILGSTLSSMEEYMGPAFAALNPHLLQKHKYTLVQLWGHQKGVVYPVGLLE